MSKIVAQMNYEKRSLHLQSLEKLARKVESVDAIQLALRQII